MKKMKNLFLYVSAISVNLVSFATGIIWAWASPSIPKLNGIADPQNNPLPRPTTLFEDSWIASLSHLGAVVGPALSVYWAHRIGRKKTLLYFSLPLLMSHVIIIFATSVYEFYVARLLMGITQGCVYTLTPIYLAEIADTSTRGVLGVSFFFSLTLGSVWIFMLSPFVTIRTLSIFSLLPSVLFLLIFGIFIPDSPYYHVLVDDIKEAEKALKKLRRSSNVQKELLLIHTTVEESKRIGNPGVKELFTNKISLKALTIGLGLMFFQQCTAMAPLYLYLKTIFDSTGSTITGDITSMVIGCISLTTCSITLKATNYVKRKTLLLVSEAMILTGLSTLGVFFYLKDHDYDTTSIYYLPIICMITYIVAYDFGMGPVPFQYVGEIFPANIKSLAGTFCITFNIGSGVIFAVLYTPMVVYLSMSVCLWIFAGLSGLGMIFVAKYVPETKDKTFLEIQNELKGEKKTMNICYNNEQA